jgi:hypothetical protein
MYMCPIPSCFRDTAISLHSTLACTDEQHAMPSHELQSALMLTVQFSKMYCITLVKLYQLCGIVSEGL